MTETPAPADRLMSLLVLLATLAPTAYYAFLATGRIDGVSIGSISAKFPTVLTPAGYAFTIWFVIFACLLAFGLYQTGSSKLAMFRPIRIIYILSCVFACGWLFFWQREMFAASLGMAVALLATLISMVKWARNAASARVAFYTKLPFGSFAGWMTVAVLVNFVVLLFIARIELSPLGWTSIGIACIGVCTLAAVAVRFYWRNFLYPLSIAWAVAAVAINQRLNTAVIVACVISVIVCLLLSTSFVMDLKGSTYE